MTWMPGTGDANSFSLARSARVARYAVATPSTKFAFEAT
jgi:hypothetical protein